MNDSMVRDEHGVWTFTDPLEGPLRRIECAGHMAGHEHDGCEYAYEDGLREVCWYEDEDKAVVR